MSPATSDPDGPMGSGADARPEAPPAPAAPVPVPVPSTVPHPDPLGAAAPWPGGVSGPPPEAVAGSGPGGVSGPPPEAVAGSGPDGVSGPPPEAVAGSWPGGPVDGYPDVPGRGGPPQPGRRRALAVGAGAALALAVLGLPLGLIWAAVAPAVPVVQTEDGAILTQPQPEEFIAADGWFSLLGLGLGVLSAAAVWLILRRYRGPVGLVAVVAGMIGAAVLAWRVGRQIGLAGYQRMLETAPVGGTFEKPPDLRAGGFEWFFGFVPTIRGDLLLPAFGAAVAYTLLAGWSRYPGLRAGAEPELASGPGPAPVSWDPAAPPAPTAAPVPPESGAAEPPRG